MGAGLRPPRLGPEQLIGAEVWGADSSEVNMPASHPLFRGLLGHMFGEQSRAIIKQSDVILICGTYVFPEVFPALEDVFATGARIVHIDLDPWEMSKNFPVDIGIMADPGAALGKLAGILPARMHPGQRELGSRTRSLTPGKMAAERRGEDSPSRQQDVGERSVPLRSLPFGRRDIRRQGKLVRPPEPGSSRNVTRQAGIQDRHRGGHQDDRERGRSGDQNIQGVYPSEGGRPKTGTAEYQETLFLMVTATHEIT